VQQEATVPVVQCLAHLFHHILQERRNKLGLMKSNAMILLTFQYTVEKN